MRSRFKDFNKYFQYALKYNNSDILVYLLNNLLLGSQGLFRKYYNKFQDDEVLKLLNSKQPNNPSVKLLNFLSDSKKPNIKFINGSLKRSPLFLQPEVAIFCRTFR